MQWAWVDADQNLVNIIVYDGVSPYEVPDGITLQQVNPWLNIGDNINDPQPVPPPPETNIPHG